jgi:hypothetical protein
MISSLVYVVAVLAVVGFFFLFAGAVAAGSV